MKPGLLLGAVLWTATALGCATSRGAPTSLPDAGRAEPLTDSTGLAAVALDASLPAEQRAEALHAFGEKAGRAALSVAVACLESPQPALRHAAADAIGRIGGKDAQAALIARLELEEDFEVRAALQFGLAMSEP